MAKYGKKIVESIVRLIKSDTFTIAEICRQVGITPKTYHQWIDDYPDFAAAVEQAKDERMQFFVQEAKKSLLKKIQGYEVTETKVVTIPSKQKDEKGNPKPIIKEQTTTKKHIQADTAAIIFTLTNGDPEHWRNRQTTEITGKDGKDLFAGKSDEELDNENCGTEKEIGIMAQRGDKIRYCKALKERLIRESRSDLLRFTLATMPTFRPADFHRRYYKVLTDFAQGKIRKLMVFMPPQHGKSEGSTRRLPAFLLGNDPEKRLAIVSYNAPKCKEIQPRNPTNNRHARISRHIPGKTKPKCRQM